MIKALFPLAASLALAGCVTSDTSMLDDRTAIVSARGNAFSNAAKVQQEVLAEAALQAVNRGFSHFVVMSATDQTTQSSYTSPTQTYSSASGNANCSGAYCNLNTYGQSTTTGGQTTNFIKPGADIMVRFLRPDEAYNAPQAWDANAILAAQTSENQ